MMPLPQLSVIIVNYNGISFLKECFDSLNGNLVGIPFEIVVVDNNSQDLSCDYIKKNFPEVRLIESKENLGFGKANNLGVKNAKGETILLLNNDTILQDQLKPAIETLYASPENGIVTINMIDGDKQYLNAVGRFPSPLKLLKISFLKDKRKVFKNGEFDDVLYDVDWVSGAFMLMRKSDFEAIDGFDSDYFMYVEDVDLCKKMADKGKKCIFQANLSYIHFVGFNTSREHLLFEGLEIYISKHFSKIEIAISKTMMSFNKFGKLIKSDFKSS